MNRKDNISHFYSPESVWSWFIDVYLFAWDIIKTWSWKAEALIKAVHLFEDSSQNLLIIVIKGHVEGADGWKSPGHLCSRQVLQLDLGLKIWQAKMNISADESKKWYLVLI